MLRRNFIATLFAVGAAQALPGPKWKHEFFNVINLERKLVPKWGMTLGCIGIRQYNDNGYWNVTHTPTGYALGLDFDNQRNAMRVCERIVAAGDWSRIDGQDHPDVKRLRDVVLPIREEIEIAVWEEEG